MYPFTLTCLNCEAVLQSDDIYDKNSTEQGVSPVIKLSQNRAKRKSFTKLKLLPTQHSEVLHVSIKVRQKLADGLAKRKHQGLCAVVFMPMVNIYGHVQMVS